MMRKYQFTYNLQLCIMGVPSVFLYKKLFCTRKATFSKWFQMQRVLYFSVISEKNGFFVPYPTLFSSHNTPMPND